MKCVIKKIYIPARLQDRLEYDFKESIHIQLISSIRYCYQNIIKKIFLSTKSLYKLFQVEQILMDPTFLKL